MPTVLLHFFQRPRICWKVTKRQVMGSLPAVDDSLCLCPGVIRILGSNVQRFSSDLCCGSVMKIKSVQVKPLTH